MGCSLIITTKKRPCFSRAVFTMMQELDSDFFEKMAQNIFYYHDYYYKSNLASVVDLCYWKDFPHKGFVLQWTFLSKLAKITDKQIEDYAKDRKKIGCNHHTILLHQEPVLEDYNELEFIDFLINKRDSLISLLEAGIIHIE